MIRNLVNIFLSLFVLCATSGVVLNKHYTDGKLFSTSLYSSPESCCEDGVSCECCHEESKTLKITDSFRTENLKLPNFDRPDCIEKSYATATFSFHSLNSQHIANNLYHHKPRLPVRKFLQVFIL